MKEDTVTTKVYLFDELSDDAKQVVIERLWNINIDHEWWDCTFDDAANVGIKLTEFDLDRYCCGIVDDAVETANQILKKHGKHCETYITADAFLCDMSHIDEDDDIAQDETKAEFERFILEDYRIMLQKQYEYLISEEVIIMAIKTNEYEFTVDGKIYH